MTYNQNYTYQISHFVHGQGVSKRLIESVVCLNEPLVALPDHMPVELLPDGRIALTVLVLPQVPLRGEVWQATTFGMRDKPQ